MARSRNIKPGLFTNDELAECPPLARLLFIGLWTLADAEGRLKDRPRQIKAQILPYDECDCDSLMINLEQSGFIQRYTVLLQPIVQVVNFTKHQNPHKNEREKGSSLGLYADRDQKHEEKQLDKKESRLIQINPEQDGSDPEDSLLMIPSTLIPDSEQKHLFFKQSEIEKVPKKENKTDPITKTENIGKSTCNRFDEFWETYPKKQNKKKSLSIWKTRKFDTMADQLIADVKKRLANDSGWRDGYIPMPTTYLNGDRWDDEILSKTTGGQSNGSCQEATRKLSAVDQAAAGAKRLTDRLERERGEREIHGQIVGEDGIDLRS